MILMMIISRVRGTRGASRIMVMVVVHTWVISRAKVYSCVVHMHVCNLSLSCSLSARVEFPMQTLGREKSKQSAPGQGTTGVDYWGPEEDHQGQQYL